MTIDPQAIQALFARAIEIVDRAEREKFLTEQCGSDAKLYERIANLLIAFDGSKGFLDQPTQAHAAPHLDATNRYQPGNTIAGRYKLLEAIGEGGMGTVWVAEQSQPVRRKVALKLVKPGMDSKQVLARFDAERQALALMDHPNIAKVFDGGVTDQGRPFFVMELVKGMPLTEYCDSARLPLEERLKLLVPICQAVQHAHQKGIIHRDLKPSNVLICLYDGKPVPKVIDFGLAKAMHQPLTEQTVHTGFGLMIGTPLYMSPEQAEHNNLDVDTRTDVYSLGVMLYELLTGSTPLEKAQFKEAALTEILRLIKEVDPPKPSTRVSSSAALPSIAAQRQLDPKLLSRTICGDLDWIVMKALDKDRNRRYETANALARDIQRFLACEPVEACPPSTAYRLNKYYAKNRTAILTVCSFAILLLASAILSGWQAIRATRSEQTAIDAQRSAQQERTQAEKQRDEAKQLKDEALVRSTELQKLTEKQRRSLYASDMNLVRLEADRGNMVRMRELLTNQLPIHNSQDLRGVEWSYWYNYLNQGKTERSIANFPKVSSIRQSEISFLSDPASLGTLTGAMLPDGELAAFSMGNETRVMRVDTGEEVQRIPLAMTNLVNRTRFGTNARSVFAQAASMSAFDSAPKKASGGITIYCPSDEPIQIAFPEQTFSHISQVTLSGDGKFVAVVGNAIDHGPSTPSVRIMIWNIDSRQIVFNQTEKREFNRIELNRDASGVIFYVAHGSAKKSDRLRVVASVWNVRRAKKIHSIQYDDDIDSATWHPTQPVLFLTTLGFSGSNTKQLLRWSLVNNKLERFSSEVMPNFVRIEASPDGKELAITSHGSEAIRLIDATTGEVSRTLFHPESQVESISYTSDGRELRAVTNQGYLFRWNLDRGPDLFGLRQAAILPGEFIREWSFDRTFTQGAFCTNDGRVVIRQRSGNEFSVDVGLMEGTVSHSVLQFSADGRYLALWLIGFKNRNPLILVDCQSGKAIWRHELSSTAPIFNHSLAFSPDQTELVICNQGKLNAFELKSGTQRPLEDNSRSYGDLVYDASGQRLMVGALTTTEPIALQIRDAMQGNTLVEMPFPNGKELELKASRLMPVAVGKHLVIVSPRQITIWNMESQQAIYQTDGTFSPYGGPYVPRVHCSADAALAVIPVCEMAFRRVTSTSAFFRIKRVDVIDLASSSRSTISLAGDYADDIKLSPDGKRLLSLHGKNPAGGLEVAAKAKLWDLQSTRELLTLPLHRCNKTTWDMYYEPEHSDMVALSFNVPFGTRAAGEPIVFDTRPLSSDADNTLIAEHWLEQLKRDSSVPEDVRQAIAENPFVSDEVRELATQFASQLTIDSDTLAKECMDELELSVAGISHARMELLMRKAQSLYRRDPNTLRSIAILSTVYYLNGEVDEALKLATSTRSEAKADVNDELLRRVVEAMCLEKSSDPLTHHKRIISIADLADRIRAQGNSRIPGMVLLVKLFNNQRDLAKELMATKPTLRIATSSKSAAPRPGIPKDPWEFPKLALAKLDKNADGLISVEELPKRASIDWLEFDADHNNSLDLVEFSTAQRVTSVLSKAKVDPKVMENFRNKDIDQDGNLSRTEYASEPVAFQAMDVDNDDRVSMTEYQNLFLRNAVVNNAFQGIIQAPPEIQLASIEYFLHVYPDEANLLNFQAWVLATCPVDKLRNGQRSLEFALKCIQGNGASIPSRLATLAAAYAESGDFKKAVEIQTKVIDMTNQQEEHIRRLEQYKADQPYRDVLSAEGTSSESAQREKPVWNESTLATFKRISGGEPCWSPDSKKLLYALTGFGAEFSYFEVLDLASGQQKVVGPGGKNPRWHPHDSTMLVFSSRKPSSLAATTEGSKVWLLRFESDQQPQLDNDQRQLLGTGECLGWDNQGKLYVRSGRLLSQVDPANPDAPKQILEGNLQTCAISPDGLRLAYSKFGKWTICELASPADSINGYVSSEDTGFTDWSPDGKFLLFGSSDRNHPGLWLVEVATGKRRLLAEIICKPRWSPDGKQIALGLLTSNEILFVDVQNLKLSSPF
jgi:serine/threonine protein kinase/WD40 repeat protein